MRLIGFIRRRPAAARQFVHGVLLSVLLGVVATVSFGGAPLGSLAVWTSAYVALALALELLIRGVGSGQVHAAANAHSLLRKLDPMDRLIARSERVELLAGTFKTFTESSADIRALHERSRRGATVRLLMMAPDGDGPRLMATERRARGSAVEPEDIEREILQSLRRFLDEFPAKLLEECCRLYTGGAHSSVYRLGDRYVVTVYTFGRGGDSPALALSRPAHEQFCDGLDRGFEELWQATTTRRLDMAALSLDASSSA